LAIPAAKRNFSRESKHYWCAWGYARGQCWKNGKVPRNLCTLK